MKTGAQAPLLAKFRLFKLWSMINRMAREIFSPRLVLKMHVQREEVPFYMTKFESKLHRHHIFYLWASFILAQPRVKELFNDDQGIPTTINLARKINFDRRSANMEYFAVDMECRNPHFRGGLGRIQSVVGGYGHANWTSDVWRCLHD